jgi:hypothetical protein
VVARGRWASLERLLVCRRTSLVVFKNCPVARPDSALRRVMGLLLRESRRQIEPGSPVCSTWDQCHPSGERGCRTAGCERGSTPAQVATGLQEAQDPSAANTVRADAKASGLSACANSEVALGESRLRGSEASLNSNCQKTGESTFHLQRRGTLHATSSSMLSNSTNGWRGLATAKLERR